MKKRLSLLLTAALLPMLAACGQSGLPTASTPTIAAQPTSAEARATTPARPRRTATSEQARGETPTTGPVETPTPGEGEDETPAVEPVESPVSPEDEGNVVTDPLGLELQATVVAGLPVTPTPGGESPGFGGFEGVHVMQIDTAEGFGPYWAAYSYGMRRFEPLEQHFVAVYSREGDGWREVDRIELEDPDYLDRMGVQQVPIEPENVWLQVESAVGAHSGCFNILRFDGQRLHNEVSHCGSAPGAGSLEDLNGDDVLDVLLDATDHYVICYACNVDYITTEVMRWDGSNMVNVRFQQVADSEPEELRELTDRAIELAEHDLWKDAQAMIEETRKFGSQDPAYIWNAALINLDATKRAEHIEYSGYPLLSTIFYGDYPAVLSTLGRFNIDAIFNPNSDLFTGSPVAGNLEFMVEYVARTTTLQLEAQPDLAAAYFVRGWALALLDPRDPSALADIQQAADLDPSEALFAEALDYLEEQQ
ncbi:MAG: hypothetical protein M3437_15020 [Chloroflexota bacterium]|nr:hypothetical protein [Chloroflexota bacterium]MDQ5865724.1 hypothetical protein [Chloroflexota bacterium]